MIDDIILNKKECIERCIKQIRHYYTIPTNLPFEDDYLKQDAIALNLQRAAEQCIDLANHIVRIKKLGIPKGSKDSFTLLAKAGIIDPVLVKKLEGMVGFRNIVVHEYQELDVGIMKKVIENNLDDLLHFTIKLMEAE